MTTMNEEVSSLAVPCCAVIVVGFFLQQQTDLNSPVTESQSIRNDAEVVAIAGVVDWLQSNDFDWTKLGIVAMYNGQVSELRKRLGDQVPAAAFSSVDGFQGRERDLMIVSLVRSNNSRACGFSTQPPRLNVAFSRAKRGLVVCGDLHQFCQGDAFGDLWDFIDAQSSAGCVVDARWKPLNRE